MENNNRRKDSITNFVGIAANLRALDTNARRIYPDFDHPHLYRSNYQRDRDRIISSASFRRLGGKTQIFNVGIGDHLETD
jgi:dGTPase